MSNLIPKHLDRRVKLTADQKETIIGLKGENISHLAKYYNVSRRTIQLLQFPERKQAVLQARKDSGKSYYDREKQGKADKATKAYREQLIKEGKLK